MATQVEPVVTPEAQEHELVFDAFRRRGYLEADLDPLGSLKPQPMPELDVSGPIAERARKIYCGTIGAEFMHMADARRRQWVQQRMEAALGMHLRPELQQRLLERLVRAEIFEQMLQSRYLGTKRFSLEGLSSLIPLLDEILAVAIAHASQQVVMAMSHRGRLNVMV